MEKNEHPNVWLKKGEIHRSKNPDALLPRFPKQRIKGNAVMCQLVLP